MTPANIQRLLQQGLAHHQAGRAAQAEQFYRQARAAAPRSPEVFDLSGRLAFEQGRYKEAVAFLRQASVLNPQSVPARFVLGIALSANGQHAEAVTYFKTVAQRTPNDPAVWNNLAFSLRIVGQLAEARAAYEKAVALKPDSFDVLDRLGAIVADMDGLPAGIPYFRRVNELKPDYAPAWGNLGLSLSAAGKYAEAISAFDRALSLDAKLTQARVGRALAFQQTYRIAEAYAEFGAVLAEFPQHHEARSGRLLTSNYLAGLSRETVFEEHLAFGRSIPPAAALPKPPATVKSLSARGGRLRVAFLSSDLRSHSVAYFLEPLLRHLDRSRFEIVLYHDHFVVDAMSERLRQHAALWRNFVGQIHDNVERVIREDAPDILIDLAGHTGVSRLPVFAHRVAPVQISYLGYPNTTGLREMDFRLVDAVTDPGPDDDRFHTEKLVRFAPCAWAFQPPASSPEPVRTQTPEPNGAPSPVVFGSFNNFAKVSDVTLALWRRVLAAVPGSRLFLKSQGLGEPGTGDFVRQKLHALVDDPARIVLAGRTESLADHLALYSQVDIALDTFPYHGTTTTCEALWMGVPLVTLLGDRHAARVSASLLTAVGHPEWIARSEDDYVRIAAELAADPAKRTALRTTLRDDVRRSDLLDHAAQARRFGEALLKCTESRAV